MQLWIGNTFILWALIVILLLILSIASRTLSNPFLVISSLQVPEKEETRFTSKKPAKEIVSSIEQAAKPLGFNVQKRDYKMKLQGDKLGRKGHLSVSTEVFEVAPSLFMVELQKNHGDTLEYNHVRAHSTIATPTDFSPLSRESSGCLGNVSEKEQQCSTLL